MPSLDAAANRLWIPLASATLFVSSHWLRLGFLDLVSRPADLIVGTLSFQVRILEGCSGCEGMTLMAAFLGVYLWLRRDRLRFPQALWLLPFAMAASWTVNTVRIALLVAVGTLISPAVAMRGFHSQAGWIMFTLLALLVIAGAEKLPGLHRELPAAEVHFPAACYVAPFLVLLFGWMASRALPVGVDVLAPLRVAAVGIALAICLPVWKSNFGRPSWRLAGGLGLAVYLIWSLLAPATGPSPVEAGRVLGPWLLPWLAVRLLGAVVAAPLAEELAFRGFLLRLLQSPGFEGVPMGTLTPLSLEVSSVAFGLLYRHWLAGLAAGLAFGWATRRGSLGDAVVAHGVTDLCLAMQAIALGHGFLWI